MRKFITLIPLLLIGCDLDSKNETPDPYAQEESVVDKADLKDERTPLNKENTVSANNLHNDKTNSNYANSLQSSDIQQYDAEKSLNKILNSSDTREIVYLIHPSNQMLVYCFHDTESECYIEGMHDNKFFKYDISQVEGQNMGKLTFHTHNIESSKTTPMKWMTVTDEYVMVLMTSKIMLNSQQNTLHEPLVIYYEKGMMVR